LADRDFRAPVPALRLNPHLPPKLDDIINRALEKDRELRYQHASDMRAELQRLRRIRGGLHRRVRARLRRCRIRPTTMRAFGSGLVPPNGCSN
jgi:serine/threonine protein kinase